MCILGNCNIEGEDNDWDFGTGAGFYLDATEEKWKKHYRMYSYITKEVGYDLLHAGIYNCQHGMMMYNITTTYIQFYFSMLALLKIQMLLCTRGVIPLN